MTERCCLTPCAWRRRLAALLLPVALGLGPMARAEVEPSAAVVAATAPSPERPGCPPPAQGWGEAELEEGLRLAPDRGLLMRITSRAPRAEGEVPLVSYLYGTIHVAQRDWVLLGPTVREALGEVDRVLLELDLSDNTVLASLQALARQPVPPLPEALAQRLQRMRDAACVDLPTGLRPELQAAALLTGLLRGEGYDPAYAIDAAVADFAVGYGKPISGLETPEQQLRHLLREDPVARAEWVSQSLDEAADPRTRATLQRLLATWDSGELGELRRYPRWCNCLTTDFQRRQWAALVDGRNAAMADQILALHRAGQSLFVAVGVLHLVGDQGLPALLEAQGYDVRWVPYSRRENPAEQR